MTERILASSESFRHHLFERHNLQLEVDQKSDIELLLRRDKDSLRLFLYQLEDQTMKRKQSQQHLEVEERKSSFLRHVHDAAKKYKEDARTGEDVNVDSYDQSESSLDDLMRSYRTPNQSQVDLPLIASSGEGGTDYITPATTRPTSASSQDSALVEASKDGKEDESYLLQLSFGVKYLITMLRSKGALPESIFSSPEGLRKLCSMSIVEAMQQCLHSTHTEMQIAASTFISTPLLEACRDLDREETLLKAGSTYLYDEQDEWCGGKVSFAGSVSFNQQGDIQTRLRPLCLKGSSRFTRRFGSSRFLRLDVPNLSEKNIQQIALVGFVNRPFYILDRRFDLLCIKEKDSRHSTAHFFEYGPDVPSLRDLLNWHGPWLDNLDGKLLKYLQRVHLGLSTSIPGPLIPNDMSYFMDDIVSSTGEVMTDGAAPISRGAMIKIASALGLESIPTAVQGRYDGAKGMWYLAPDRKGGASGDNLWIGVRDSQRKLRRSVTTETCHQVFDVLRMSTVTTPSSLSLQILLVLSNNGVPHSTILKMQREQLQEVMNDLFGEEEKKKDGLQLAKSLADAASIYFTRAKRSAHHLAAAQGLTSRAAEDLGDKANEESTEDGEIDGPSAEHQTVFERAYDMLLAGFEVEQSRTLMDLVIKAAKTTLDRAVKEFRLRLQRSAEVFVIPDPCGVLLEGEIQLRFGRRAPIDPTTKMRLTSLEGDVLVTRHPCLTPTDIRKVKAAAYPELADYTDVIIFSTQGSTPLASLLSGGDYDGDLVRVIWDPDLVKPFHNADVEQCQPSISIADAFDQDTHTVDDFIKGLDQDKRLVELINAPERSSGSKGIYGHLQKVAAYMKGCGSQEAIDLAFKFNNSMDGVKTGLIIKKDVLRQDRAKYDRELPKWADKERKSNLDVPAQNTAPEAKRDKGLKSCILDILYEAGNQEAGKMKGDMEDKHALHWFKKDQDITNRWQEAVRLRTLSESQIEAMEEHSLSVLSLHNEARQGYAREKDEKRLASVSPSKKPRSFARCDSAISYDSPRAALRFSQFPQLFEAWIHDDEKAFKIAGLAQIENKKLPDMLDIAQLNRLQALLASCLYLQTCKRNLKSEKAAFDIASPRLLNIKAEETKRRLDEAVSDRHRPEVVIVSRPVAHALRLGKIL